MPTMCDVMTDMVGRITSGKCSPSTWTQQVADQQSEKSSVANDFIEWFDLHDDVHGSE